MAPSRKDVLRAAASIPALVGLTAYEFPENEVKTQKTAVAYQGSPKDGQLCATCLYYVPKTGSSGDCKIVEGTVSPKGWCVVYAAKVNYPKG